MNAWSWFSIVVGLANGVFSLYVEIAFGPTPIHVVMTLATFGVLLFLLVMYRYVERRRRLLAVKLRLYKSITPDDWKPVIWP